MRTYVYYLIQDLAFLKKQKEEAAAKKAAVEKLKGKK